jgi:zinc protease
VSKKSLSLVALSVFALACTPPAEGTSPANGNLIPTTTAPQVPPTKPDWSKLPTPGDPPKWSVQKPEIFALTNGMKVYFQKQGPTPLVSVVLVMPRGAGTDPKGKAGLTSLTIDLMDEGAAGKSALELGDELQRLGTDYGGGADVDAVVFSMNLIAENLAPSAKLFADIVRRPTLSQKEFQRRKDQQLASALSNESEPTSARGIVQRRALFGDGYAGTPVGGVRNTLQKLTLADVKAHYTALVSPEGAALVAVGGVDKEPVRKALEEAFGNWTGKATAKTAPVSSAKPEPGIYFIDFPGSSQSALSIARRAGNETSPEYFPSMLFARAFGEAFTSRLNLNLREDKGYTYGARAGFSRWKDVGFFSLGAGVKMETTRASIDESLKELREVCSNRPLTDKELAEGHGGLLLGFPARFESADQVAGQLADLPLYGREDDWLEKWQDRVKAVTLGQANDIAKAYCDPKEFVIIIAGDGATVEPTLEGLNLKVTYFDAQGTKLPGRPARKAEPKQADPKKPDAAGKKPAK